MALTGSYQYFNILFGFVLSFFVLWLLSRQSGNRKYFFFVLKLISFCFYFFYELLKANWEVAKEIITPTFYMEPGIVKMPLDAKSDIEITILANMITLTPGTLVIDISHDKKVMYIHGMYVRDRDSFIDYIKNTLEKPLLKLTRI
jgi:multicomponent Na+:H+ antiporter subunit E